MKKELKTISIVSIMLLMAADMQAMLRTKLPSFSAYVPGKIQSVFSTTNKAMSIGDQVQAAPFEGWQEFVGQQVQDNVDISVPILPVEFVNPVAPQTATEFMQTATDQQELDCLRRVSSETKDILLQEKQYWLEQSAEDLSGLTGRPALTFVQGCKKPLGLVCRNSEWQKLYKQAEILSKHGKEFLLSRIKTTVPSLKKEERFDFTDDEKHLETMIDQAADMKDKLSVRVNESMKDKKILEEERQEQFDYMMHAFGKDKEEFDLDPLIQVGAKAVEQKSLVDFSQEQEDEKRSNKDHSQSSKSRKSQAKLAAGIFTVGTIAQEASMLEQQENDQKDEPLVELLSIQMPTDNNVDEHVLIQPEFQERTTSVTNVDPITDTKIVDSDAAIHSNAEEKIHELIKANVIGHVRKTQDSIKAKGLAAVWAALQNIASNRQRTMWLAEGFAGMVGIGVAYKNRQAIIRLFNTSYKDDQGPDFLRPTIDPVIVSDNRVSELVDGQTQTETEIAHSTIETVVNMGVQKDLIESTSLISVDEKNDRNLHAATQIDAMQTVQASDEISNIDTSVIKQEAEVIEKPVIDFGFMHIIHTFIYQTTELNPKKVINKVAVELAKKGYFLEHNHTLMKETLDALQHKRFVIPDPA